MKENPTALPPQSPWLWKWFRWYCTRYAAKHFHAVRLSNDGFPLPAGTGEPLLFVVNHPGWWDIVICMGLTDRYRHYRHFAPIDAEMLPKYKFFKRLGFFGVDPSIAGSRHFLKTASAVFGESSTALWITAQGHFVDARVRPTELRPGVGHLVAGLERGWVVPIALEYPFWDESRPEALLRVGEPLPISGGGDKADWTRRIGAALEAAQDALAKEAIARDPGLFTTSIAGSSGVGGVYDIWRRIRAGLTGRKAILSHRDGREPAP